MIQLYSNIAYHLFRRPLLPSFCVAINVTAVGGGDCEKRSTTIGRRQMANSNGEAYNLSVLNLAEGSNWRDLKDLFRPCGSVDWVDVTKEGKGVVRFNKKEDAQNAIERLNGFSFNGQELEVKLDQKS
jgi:RNA recognition motif-containing protein